MLASFATTYMRHKEHVNPNTRFFGLKPRSWSRLLGEFVLALSDQQLLTGLIILVVGMARYYITSVTLGSNNMWTAAGIVIFLSVTHGATMVAARPYFRKHRQRSIFRVGIMCITYLLWLAMAVDILSPVKPETSEKLSKRLTDFWHAATYIEIFGVAWMYLIVITPLFLSRHAAEVRSAIAQLASSDEVAKRLEMWEAFAQIHCVTPAKVKMPYENTGGFLGRLLCTLKRFTQDHATLKAIRSRIRTRARGFCQLYITRISRRQRQTLWIVAEIFWPWWTALVLIGLLWLFGFAIMIVNMIQNDLDGDWGFDQLLSPALISLPVYELVVSIIDARHGAIDDTGEELPTLLSPSD